MTAATPGLERPTEAPAKIWATVNGASTRLPDGGRQLIGGWSEDADRPRAVEYVRADLATPPAGGEVRALREALEPFRTFADHAVERADGSWVWSASSRDRICDWFGPTDFGGVVAAIASPAEAAQAGEAIESYSTRQIEWSRETFGPNARTGGVIDHIRKELLEIEAEPTDLSEWVDVIILAMDGFWRHGGSATDLMPKLLAKQRKNMARTWPDWRTMSEDSAIEHDRTGEAPTPSREEVPTDEQVRPVVELFANCDAWTAKEWMQRLVNAVNLRDQAVRDGNDLAFETYNNIASSTASRIARECADEIFAALKAAGPSAQQRVSEEARFLLARLDEFIRDADGISSINTNWFGHIEPAIKRLEAALSPENGGA